MWVDKIQILTYNKSISKKIQYLEAVILRNETISVDEKTGSYQENEQPGLYTVSCYLIGGLKHGL